MITLPRRKFLTLAAGLIAAPVIVRASAIMPVREIRHDWLACLGQEISSHAYPELFKAIGHLYGGSGSAFNLPNCGRFPIPSADLNGIAEADVVVKIATRTIVSEGVGSGIPVGFVSQFIEAPNA
jgi:hypothetical protein